MKLSIITYVGGGNFEGTLEDGTVKELGPNVKNQIRWTYFRDFALPHIGWSCTHQQFWDDYTNKMSEFLEKNQDKIYNSANYINEEEGVRLTRMGDNETSGYFKIDTD